MLAAKEDIKLLRKLIQKPVIVEVTNLIDILYTGVFLLEFEGEKLVYLVLDKGTITDHSFYDNMDEFNLVFGEDHIDDFSALTDEMLGFEEIMKTFTDLKYIWYVD